VLEQWLVPVLISAPLPVRNLTGKPRHCEHHITLHQKTIYSGLNKSNFNKDHYGDVVITQCLCKRERSSTSCDTSMMT